MDNTYNLVTICGENNVGKTNILRAIDLFCNPTTYDIALDRHTLKQAQGGAKIAPKIIIEFWDSKSNYYYLITHDLKDFKINSNYALSGYKYQKKNGKRDSKIQNILEVKEIITFINSIEFRYIESININVPKLIKDLTIDVIDVEYDKSRIIENRKI